MGCTRFDSRQPGVLLVPLEEHQMPQPCVRAADCSKDKEEDAGGAPEDTFGLAGKVEVPCTHERGAKGNDDDAGEELEVQCCLEELVASVAIVRPCGDAS